LRNPVIAECIREMNDMHDDLFKEGTATQWRQP
jgi:hypothetical protein